MPFDRAALNSVLSTRMFTGSQSFAEAGQALPWFVKRLPGWVLELIVEKGLTFTTETSKKASRLFIPAELLTESPMLRRSALPWPDVSQGMHSYFSGIEYSWPGFPKRSAYLPYFTVENFYSDLSRRLVGTGSQGVALGPETLDRARETAYRFLLPSQADTNLFKILGDQAPYCVSSPPAQLVGGSTVVDITCSKLHAVEVNIPLRSLMGTKDSLRTQLASYLFESAKQDGTLPAEIKQSIKERVLNSGVKEIPVPEISQNFFLNSLFYLNVLFSFSSVWLSRTKLLMNAKAFLTKHDDVVWKYQVAAALLVTFLYTLSSPYYAVFSVIYHLRYNNSHKKEPGVLRRKQTFSRAHQKSHDSKVDAQEIVGAFFRRACYYVIYILLIETFHAFLADEFSANAVALIGEYFYGQAKILSGSLLGSALGHGSLKLGREATRLGRYLETQFEKYRADRQDSSSDDSSESVLPEETDSDVSSASKRISAERKKLRKKASKKLKPAASIKKQERFLDPSALETSSSLPLARRHLQCSGLR